MRKKNWIYGIYKINLVLKIVLGGIIELCFKQFNKSEKNNQAYILYKKLLHSAVVVLD